MGGGCWSSARAGAVGPFYLVRRHMWHMALDTGHHLLPVQKTVCWCSMQKDRVLVQCAEDCVLVQYAASAVGGTPVWRLRPILSVASHPVDVAWSASSPWRRKGHGSIYEPKSLTPQ